MSAQPDFLAGWLPASNKYLIYDKTHHTGLFQQVYSTIMILYFSATGNCKWVAQRMGEALSDSPISILDCIKEERFSFEDSVVGIVSPTYDWGIPSVVREFLSKVRLEAGYLFFVATYGTNPASRLFCAEIPGAQDRRFLLRPDAGYLDGPVRPVHS